MANCEMVRICIVWETDRGVCRLKLFDVRRRADRNDSRRVDLRVRPVVVLLDVSEIGRVLEGWVVPVEVLEPSVQVGVGVSNWKL